MLNSLAEFCARARSKVKHKGREGWRTRLTIKHPCMYMHHFGQLISSWLHVHVRVECRGFESHLRQLIFLRKSDRLGCAVLLCLVCLFDLACFFLSSFLLSSLIKTCMIITAKMWGEFPAPCLPRHVWTHHTIYTPVVCSKKEVRVKMSGGGSTSCCVVSCLTSESSVCSRWFSCLKVWFSRLRVSIC